MSLENCIGHSAGKELNRTDSVVISGNYIVNIIGIAVGINNGDNGMLSL